MSAPAVLFLKAGRFPMAYGMLGGIRSAAGIGCAAYADVDSRWAPCAVSRRLSGRLAASQSPVANPLAFVQALLAAPVPGPAILIATDDASAVLAASHGNALKARYVMPLMAPNVVQTLSTKASLTRLCDEIGIPAPRTLAVNDDTVAQMRFPVVVKVDQPWQGRAAGHMTPTTVIQTPEQLRGLTGLANGVICQEYLPAQGGQDWIVEAYVGVEGEILFLGTARKYRSWLPGVGVACMARAEPNPAVAGLARRLLSAVPYRGLVDLDFRLDPRDGQYKLLDCNARMGAAAALFASVRGLDLVQIAILDLAGFDLPVQTQAYGRRLVVENLDLPARLIQRDRVPGGQHERRVLGWWDARDPLPFVTMVPWQARQWSTEVLRRMLRG